MYYFCQKIDTPIIFINLWAILLIVIILVTEVSITFFPPLFEFKEGPSNQYGLSISLLFFLNVKSHIRIL